MESLQIVDSESCAPVWCDNKSRAPLHRPSQNVKNQDLFDIRWILFRCKTLCNVYSQYECNVDKWCRRRYKYISHNLFPDRFCYMTPVSSDTEPGKHNLHTKATKLCKENRLRSNLSSPASSSVWNRSIDSHDKYSSWKHLQLRPTRYGSRAYKYAYTRLRVSINMRKLSAEVGSATDK